MVHCSQATVKIKIIQINFLACPLALEKQLWNRRRRFIILKKFDIVIVRSGFFGLGNIFKRFFNAGAL